MKVVYDTCLYIDLLRSGARLDLFQNRSSIRFLSPIVLMELRAGARSAKQKKIVDRLIYPYSKAARIIHLDANLFYKAGEALSLLAKRGASLHRGLSNDVLIATSARSIGAVLLTRDRRDFEMIEKVIPVNVNYV